MTRAQGVFTVGRDFVVPDGTRVAPLFNALDSLSVLPAGLPESFSVAVGTLAAGQRSKIHLMPHVAQLTFVLAGSVTLRTKSATDRAPRNLRLTRHQAALTPAGALLQLINDSSRRCRLLYIVSPSYVFEWRDGRVIYDDAVMLDESWGALARRGWRLTAPLPTRRARTLAAARVRQKCKPKRTP